VITLTFDTNGGSGSPIDDPDLMTLTKIAKFLRVRPTDVMAAVRDGEIPVHQVGRRLWFSRAEVTQAMHNARPRDDGSDQDR
jgi:excisionase family DNA binding protein